MAPSFVTRAARKLGVAKSKNPRDPSQAKTADTVELIAKPSLPSKTTEIASDESSSLPTSTETPSQKSSALDGDASVLQASTTKEDLWDLAYKLLKNDKKKSPLIGEYEGILLEDSKGGSASPSIAHDFSSTGGRERQMSRVVQDKFQAVQHARWKFAIFSKEIEVRKQFDRAVGAVTWAKDFITQAVSPDPHAALAWAGVCVLLPLLLNPSLQRNAAVGGLDTVSNLIRQSKVIDEIYFESKAETKTQALRALTDEFRDKRIKLYSQILEFEAQLVCYFSTNKVQQTVRDMIKYDSWDGMVKNIQKMGGLSSSDRQIIDAERMNAGFEKFDRISKSIEDGLSGLRRRWEDRDRRDILGWLSPIDSRTRQIDTLSRRQEGTGQWLFEDPAFERWLCGAERTLWCCGIPGAGKTILAATVIDYLEHRFHKDNVAIAFLYCNYKERDTQTLQNLIGSLIQQLVQRHPDVPDDLMVLHEAHARNQPPTPPTLTECVQLLRSQLAGCQSVFLVIDALDECDAQTRSDLCDEFERLPESTHLMITSRYNPELEDQITPSARLEIRANDRDIEMYLEDQIKRKTRLKRHTQSDPGLGPLITNTIRDKAQGMFLLAQLHLESLADNHTPNDVRDSLERLPTSLDAIYDDVMVRVSKNKTDALLGKKVLTWISYARRPLTVTEIQHAIKVKTNSRGLRKGDLVPADLLISVCAGIVTVDNESNIIRLVHYTAQEYFLQTRSRHFQDAEREVANACLTYLSFDNFRSGYCETDEALKSLLEENSLLDYAARHWADHAREVTGPVVGATLNFLEDTSRTSLSFQVMTIGSYYGSGYSQWPSKSVSGLHLCASFGVHFIPMIIRMLETQSKVDVEDSYGRTPLSWAAENGHIGVVKLLLEKGANVDSKDKNGRTVLWWAVLNGHEAVVTLLLEQGANVDSKAKNGQTPLSWAALSGHEAVVKLLLENGANIDSKNNSGRTPLLWAAWNSCEDVVKLLLEKGANVDSKCDNGRTPLWWAANYGYEVVVKLLLEKGADVDSKDNNSLTPLSGAAIHGGEAVVKLLLEKGADVDSKDNNSQTPLSWAAQNGHEAVVKLLLEKCADVDSKDDNSQTPLWLAAFDGHEAVVKLLLEKGADVDSKDNDDSQTPLSGAANHGHEAVVKLLLEKGADVDSKDNNGQTPLSRAVLNGHEAMVKLLLEKGADQS